MSSEAWFLLLCLERLFLLSVSIKAVPKLLMSSPQATTTHSPVWWQLVSFFDSLALCFLPSCLTTGYRHVYLEGLTEASVFVHVSVHDVYGKVSVGESWCLLLPSIPPVSLFCQLRWHFGGKWKKKKNISLNTSIYWSNAPSILCLSSGAH